MFKVCKTCVQNVPENGLSIVKAQQNIPKGRICFANKLSLSTWILILFSTGSNCLSQRGTFTCIDGSMYRGPNYRVLLINSRIRAMTAFASKRATNTRCLLWECIGSLGAMNFNYSGFPSLASWIMQLCNTLDKLLPKKEVRNK